MGVSTTMPVQMTCVPLWASPASASFDLTKGPISFRLQHVGEGALTTSGEKLNKVNWSWTYKLQLEPVYLELPFDPGNLDAPMTSLHSCI